MEGQAVVEFKFSVVIPNQFAHGSMTLDSSALLVPSIGLRSNDCS